MTQFRSYIVVVICLDILISSVFGLHSENIVGGLDDAGFKFPYQIVLKSYGQVYCGGALIAPNIVLTANHCVYDAKRKFLLNRGFTAVANRTTNEGNIDIPVEKIYSYKDPNSYFFNNDIAVLRLAKNFTIDGYYIDLVKLPEKYENFIGKTATVSGAGAVNYTFDKTGIGKPIYSPYSDLKYADVMIVHPLLCKRRPPPFYTVVCGHIIQKSPDSHEGFCNGDSGGPLVYENKVIGIVSANIDCDESKTPGHYAAVSFFLDFIENAINDNPTQDMVVFNITPKTFPTILNNNNSVTIPREQAVLEYLEKVQLLLGNLEKKIEKLKQLNNSLFELHENNPVDDIAYSILRTEYSNNIKAYEDNNKILQELKNDAYNLYKKWSRLSL